MNSAEGCQAFKTAGQSIPPTPSPRETGGERGIQLLRNRPAKSRMTSSPPSAEEREKRSAFSSVVRHGCVRRVRSGRAGYLPTVTSTYQRLPAPTGDLPRGFRHWRYGVPALAGRVSLRDGVLMICRRAPGSSTKVQTSDLCPPPSAESFWIKRLSSFPIPVSATRLGHTPFPREPAPP